MLQGGHFTLLFLLGKTSIENDWLSAFFSMGIMCERFSLWRLVSDLSSRTYESEYYLISTISMAYNVKSNACTEVLNV